MLNKVILTFLYFNRVGTYYYNPLNVILTVQLGSASFYKSQDMNITSEGTWYIRFEIRVHEYKGSNLPYLFKCSYIMKHFACKLNLLLRSLKAWQLPRSALLTNMYKLCLYRSFCYTTTCDVKPRIYTCRYKRMHYLASSHNIKLSQNPLNAC